MTGITEENAQITFEEAEQMINDADDMYHENDTFSNLLTRLYVYVTNIPCLVFSDRVHLLIRFLKIFTDGDVLSYNLLSSHPPFREMMCVALTHMENAFSGSDLLGVSELLEEVENVKHIIDEFNSDSDDSELITQDDIEGEIEDGCSDYSSDEDIFLEEFSSR